MNRVLKRPMFRMGGSTGTGITSGLDVPRQQYNQAGIVKNPFDMDKKVQNMQTMRPDILNMMMNKQFPNREESTEGINSMQATGDTATGGGTNLEDAIAMARAKSKELSPSNQMTSGEFSSRFLIPFGLDLTSRSPRGNLLSTIAASAKEPLSNLYQTIDKRKASATERESDLFNTFLSAGLEDSRFNRKQAAEKLKESEQLLTLYDRSLERNVIVRASEVYKNLENFGPAKADKSGRPFEKLEVAEQIKKTMGKIFELRNKKDLSIDEKQELEQAETVLDYLKGSKNTRAFADSLLKDPNFLQDIRTRIQKRFQLTEEYKKLEKNGLTEQEKLIIQRKIDGAVNLYLETGTFSPELMLADGGRAAYQGGGDVMAAADTPKIDFDTLRARLPKEIGDDIVRLISTSPEALEDFATIQTQQDVNNFNMKYSVELILPAEA